VLNVQLEKSQMQLKAAKSGLAKMFFYHTYRTNPNKITVKLLRIEIML